MNKWIEIVKKHRMETKKKAMRLAIRKAVKDYRTKHEEGFTGEEIEKIKEQFPVNEQKFYDVLLVNTAPVIDGEILTYHYDVEMALIAGVENRQLNIEEWD